MNIILIILVTALWAFIGCPEYITDHSIPTMVRAMYYPFFHANIFHLLCNCMALWTVFMRRVDNASTFLLSYIISVAVYPLAFCDVVGISNLIYAAIGIRTPRLSSSWWRQTPVLVFLVVTALMAFIPNISATTHIAAFLCGMFVSKIKRTYYGIEYGV